MHAHAYVGLYMYAVCVCIWFLMFVHPSQHFALAVACCLTALKHCLSHCWLKALYPEWSAYDSCSNMFLSFAASIIKWNYYYHWWWSSLARVMERTVWTANHCLMKIIIHDSTYAISPRCGHWSGSVFILMKFSSLAALKVVKMTTASAASDGGFIGMTTVSFQWLERIILSTAIIICFIH